MQNELTTVAIAAFLASTVSAQTPTTASVERVVYLTNMRSPQGFQEMATAVRTVAQISILSIDSEHNSLGLRGTASGRDGRMDDSHDGQTSWLAAFLSGDLEPGDARVPRANTSTTPRHRRVCRRSSQWCAPWPRIQKIFSYTPSRVVALSR